MKRNLCVSVKCAGICQVGSEETNGLISIRVLKYAARLYSVQIQGAERRKSIQRSAQHPSFSLCIEL